MRSRGLPFSLSLIGAAALALTIGATAPAPAGTEPSTPSPQVSSASPGCDAEPWTLERCLREAAASSHELRATESQLAAARARADAARAARWPTLSLASGFRYVSEVMTLEMAVPGAPARRIEFGDGRTYELGLGARLAVFRGGELIQRARSEEAGARAAAYDLAADSLTLARDVRKSYYAALGAGARAEAARVAAQRLKRHLDDLAYQIEVGAATEEARVSALARLRVAEQALARAEGELSSARLALGRLVGLPTDAVTPEGDLDLPLIDDADLSPAAAETRPELDALAERAEQSRRLARAIRGSYWPSVTAEGMFHYDRPGIDVIANDWMSYGTLGVGLQWTLWDRGARSRRVAEATAALQRLVEVRAGLAADLQSGLETARVMLAAAREETAKARERVSLESRRLELVSGRYQEALASESELLDSQDDLAEAEAALAETLVGMRLAEVEFLYLAGR